MTGAKRNDSHVGAAPDDMGLGYLLPLLSCEDDARRLDSEVFVLQVAAASPLVSVGTRARVAETAEAWRAFRRHNAGVLGCFGPGAIRRVAEFAQAIDDLRREVARDSLRPPVPPAVAIVPAVVSPAGPPPWPAPGFVTTPAPAHGGRTALLVMGALVGVGAYAYHSWRRRAR